MRNVGSRRRPPRRGRHHPPALLELGAVTRLRSRHGQFVLVMVMCALLAACAEEESGPQFANEPAPTRLATEIPVAASPVTGRATPVAATPVSIADLLATRGAPARLFATANNAIWAVSSSGESEQVYAPAPGERVVAIDAAPGGERVAVVLGTTVAKGERTDVAIFASSGEIVARFDNLGVASVPRRRRESLRLRRPSTGRRRPIRPWCFSGTEHWSRLQSDRTKPAPSFRQRKMTLHSSIPAGLPRAKPWRSSRRETTAVSGHCGCSMSGTGPSVMS